MNNEKTLTQQKLALKANMELVEALEAEKKVLSIRIKELAINKKALEAAYAVAEIPSIKDAIAAIDLEKPTLTSRIKEIDSLRRSLNSIIQNLELPVEGAGQSPEPEN